MAFLVNLTNGLNMASTVVRFHTNNPESAANDSVGHTNRTPLKEEVFTS